MNPIPTHLFLQLCILENHIKNEDAAKLFSDRDKIKEFSDVTESLFERLEANFHFQGYENFCSVLCFRIRVPINMIGPTTSPDLLHQNKLRSPCKTAL